MNESARWFTALLGRRPSTLDGELRASGLGAPVQVVRDAYGIPTITAGSDHDAWFGLGFCHAQDRAGQLEFIVRTVRGTLSALVGPDALAVDRLARRMAFAQVGSAQVALALPWVSAQLEAYARGVNAGLDATPRPLELCLLGAPSTRWTAGDVQGYCALLCFALASNWDLELVRWRVLSEDGPEALAALDPSYPPHLPTSLPPFAPAGEAAGGLLRDLGRLLAATGGVGGSNAWALDGSRTRSGRPLVAGDPHLPPTAPSPWYLCHLRTPTWEAAGGVFVGVPAVGMGHNGHGAWAVTAGHADNTDLYLEALSPDGRSVRGPDGWQRCRERVEVLEVRGQAPVTELVLETPRGPVVSPAFDGHRHGTRVERAPGARYALSLRAAWREPRPYTGLLGMHTARSAEAFHALFREGSTSAVSPVWADVTGVVAWRLAMEVPRRRAGLGMLPEPAWLPDGGWAEHPIPHAEMPQVTAPSSGYVVTANNAPTPAAHPLWLGADWLDGHRARTLVDALGAREDWDLEGTRTLQRDLRAPPWESLRGSVLAAPVRSTDGARALALLRPWDGRLTARSCAASVYALFTAALCQRVVRARAPRSASWALGRGMNALLPYNLLFTRRLGHLTQLVASQPAGWLPEGWPSALAEALESAVGTLRARFGEDPGAWAWGRVRPLRLVHPFGSIALLGRVFNRGPFEGFGDASTVAQGATDLEDPLKNPVAVPSLRMQVDVGAWPRSRWAILGGQSGDPTSPHYCDQVSAWEDASGLPIAWTEEEVQKSARHRLVLAP
ncbi:MAG: penicillin acylase family protein [Deltaproteobacteria bacterium]|nr:penicillin acylase family protein [Deltaproteobacteria bacterium]